MQDKIDPRSFIQAGKVIAAQTQGENPFLPVKLHPKQRLFTELTGVREALFGGATGGGKTVSLLADALRYIHIPGYSVLLLRRTFPDLEQEGGLIDLAHKWFQSTDARWSERRREWVFPSGAKIRFGHLATDQDKYKYAGGEYQYIGFDELTQFHESQYTWLFSRLRAKESLRRAGVELRVRGATNPGGIGGQWVYDRFIPEDFKPERAREMKIWWNDRPESKTKTAFVPSLLNDNPSLDQESYMLSLEQLDPITRAQYISGEWLIQLRGDILYMYSEPHTVISWSAFEKAFGTRSIPDHWLLEMYQDWGTTKDHPCVTTWFATAAENAPKVNGVDMAGSVFLYRSLTREQATARQVGMELRELMQARGELSRVRRFEMSHEASSERMEYIQLGMPATTWPQGKTRGIEQLKYALTLTDEHLPHPFWPNLKGHPKLYFIVDDDGVAYPRTDAHHARVRGEALAYKWAETSTGEPALKLAPHPLYNDAMDTLRAAAANYFPRMQERSLAEILEKRTNEKLLPAEQMDPVARDISVQMARLMTIREMRQEGYDIDDLGQEGAPEEIGW